MLIASALIVWVDCLCCTLCVCMYLVADLLFVVVGVVLCCGGLFFRCLLYLVC